MSITRFEELKTRRYFYVSIFRKLGHWIILSLFLNVLLILGLAYIFFTQPPSTFYSTNGRSNPILLSSMEHPNYTSNPLLPDEVK
jgi:intracellular multiplication protein IcmM